jgi:Gpi18-like mannosyltransferase
LGQKLIQDDAVAATAALLFICSPASIHHSMLYTEALFTASSWLGVYCLYCRGSSLAASLAFAGSSAVRSNGE